MHHLRQRLHTGAVASASAALLLLALSGGAQAMVVTPLNDTGQTLCNNGGAMVTCTDTTTGDASPHPRQDGRFGRDADPSLAAAKVGGGEAGFDFTRMCQNGAATECTGPENTSGNGLAAGDWVCTRDNVTGLVWSLHNGQGDWSQATASTPASQIDQDNTQARCGLSTGWRLPTTRELLSVVHSGRHSPAIDIAYFPATQSDYYWTNDPYVLDPSIAWIVDAAMGFTDIAPKTSIRRFRLVNSAP